MRTKRRKIAVAVRCVASALLSAGFLLPGTLSARPTDGDVRLAVGVLKDIRDDFSKEEAVEILQEAASDTAAYAMNALGMAYMEGIGVEMNLEKSVYWLSRAGEAGLADAYHNLGAVYKRGRKGISQDFTKAYEAFAAGADKGSAVCMYDAGFMLYKGLGCRQDYEKAANLFEASAGKGHAAAMYMLGLCYRNGYGVTQDEEKGIELLTYSADLGYSAAMEELQRPNPENCFHDLFAGNDTYRDVPASMPQINTEVNDTTMLRGRYSGYIVMYDWSGEHVLGEKPVMMSLERNGCEASGFLLLGNDSVPVTADIANDGSLKFKNSHVSMNERYSRDGRAKYRLDYADLDLWQDNIRGRLGLYSIEQREPERPMYMELNRMAADGTQMTPDGQYGYIMVTPNPFDAQFDALFELTAETDAVARIFDKFGVMVWHKDLGRLEQGRHRITLSSQLPQGHYVLNISAGKTILRTIIVKKGGVQ